ncbi:hypothetical protein Np121112_174 [Cyanophage S-RIM12_Np_22_1112]|uniref:Uncharacterized protein n=2 Tax=Brizovirus syn33 TaxID=2734097 RepID=A0A1D7SPP9_9CAUD|nr:hypothetical protein Np121112_174 [Cyanophage S-RIM12_Np_22_1112]
MMLSFKALSERKTKVKINPRQSEITEKECGCDDKKKKKCPKCDGKGCKHCGGTGYHDEDGEGADMSEAKKKDDSYLEVNFKKRQKNNEKARKEMDKVPGQKNPHFESKENSAYVSQEEVSEESTEEVAETETLLTFKQFEEAEKRIKVKGSDKSKKIMPDAGPAYYKKPKDHVKYEEVVNEEGADSLKDRRMERGGVGGNQRYNKPISNTPNTFGKKKPKYDGMSALDKVKAEIEKQYGKGAIMDTKKKK